MKMQDLERALSEEVEESKIRDEIILLSDAAEEKEKETNYTRYHTGLMLFDDVAKLRETDQGGLAGGDLLVVAGPTGNGKTLMAATISHNLLEQSGIASLWLTYEISVYALWRIFEGMGAKKESLLYAPVNHTTGKLEWVEKKIREAKEKYMVGNVVIDHLGFLAPFQKMNQNMTQNYSSFLGQIVRELKTIAVRENISIVLPVHMVKSATDDPSLRDIGHSGGIAQESDFVLLVAREEAAKSKIDVIQKDYYTEYTRVILAKNRVGGVTPSWWMTVHGGKLVETTKTGKSESERIYG